MPNRRALRKWGAPLFCHATSGAALPEALTGLMSETNEVRRVGNNLNQAVTQLNAAGIAPA